MPLKSLAEVHPDCVLIKNSTDNSSGRGRDVQEPGYLYTSKVIYYCKQHLMGQRGSVCVLFKNMLPLQQ